MRNGKRKKPLTSSAFFFVGLDGPGIRSSLGERPGLFTSPFFPLLCMYALPSTLGRLDFITGVDGMGMESGSQAVEWAALAVTSLWLPLRTGEHLSQHLGYRSHGN